MVIILSIAPETARALNPVEFGRSNLKFVHRTGEPDRGIALIFAKAFASGIRWMIAISVTQDSQSISQFRTLDCTAQAETAANDRVTCWDDDFQTTYPTHRPSRPIVAGTVIIE